ncbi:MULTISPECIES: DUF2284 domain-containing protein [unclassified Archaeoglobus]|jgi:predicted metal-binding protein|uniref:DUF2284 domain-containing protein n=1 Tax=unclassified Archaeoglobus TaxID=2643606 RepID=UPI0025C4CD0C|nr:MULTISPECIES: DUF2284 domain-containing protein [unclassified Archaeoglobus]
MVGDIRRLIEKYGLTVEIEEIEPAALRLDLRARWKCMFGCENFGKPSCPPNVPEYEECVRFVKAYKRAILFRFKIKEIEDVKRAQEFMVEAEMSLKKPYTLATFPGGCVICEECKGKCEKARPSVSALCIDASQFRLRDEEMVAVLFVE